MGWYEKRYKVLFIIPALLLLLSIAYIGITSVQRGDIVDKGVSLQGGVSVTVSLDNEVTADQVQTGMEARFPQADIRARVLETGSGLPTFIIDAADVNEDTQQAADDITTYLQTTYSVDSLSVETTGPALGDAFFVQTIMGILLAFLWMGIVVYLYFGESGKIKLIMALVALLSTVLVVNGTFGGTFGIVSLALIVLASMIVYFFSSVPSGAVILAAASTIIFVLAVINLLGVRLSTAGVAAFLMLIGYSVDTDILLSTRLLKEQDGTLDERMWGAFTTGITMQLTTTAAVLIAFLLSTSEVIRQIMMIILIGMVGDIIFTWLQNAGILFWYVKKLESAKGGKR